MRTISRASYNDLKAALGKLDAIRSDIRTGVLPLSQDGELTENSRPESTSDGIVNLPPSGAEDASEIEAAIAAKIPGEISKSDLLPRGYRAGKRKFSDAPSALDLDEPRKTSTNPRAANLLLREN